MIVLDASVLISFLAHEPAADRAEDLLRGEPCATTPVGVAEVIDEFVRLRGRSNEEVVRVLQILVAGGLDVLPLNDDDGRIGGGVRAEHYHRRRRPISMADCMTLAAAINRQAGLATCDAALAELARELGVRAILLPNSAGQLP